MVRVTTHMSSSVCMNAEETGARRHGQYGTSPSRCTGSTRSARVDPHGPFCSAFTSSAVALATWDLVSIFEQIP